MIAGFLLRNGSTGYIVS